MPLPTSLPGLILHCRLLQFSALSSGAGPTLPLPPPPTPPQAALCVAAGSSSHVNAVAALVTSLQCMRATKGRPLPTSPEPPNQGPCFLQTSRPSSSGLVHMLQALPRFLPLPNSKPSAVPRPLLWSPSPSRAFPRPHDTLCTWSCPRWLPRLPNCRLLKGGKCHTVLCPTALQDLGQSMC